MNNNVLKRNLPFLEISFFYFGNLPSKAMVSEEVALGTCLCLKGLITFLIVDKIVKHRRSMNCEGTM